MNRAILGFVPFAVGMVSLCIAAPDVIASGGTTTIASPGRPAAVSAGWPEGVAAIVNDPTRTSGWNSWFSQWPNDVNQYAFEVATTDDLNRLIGKLAATKSAICQVRLSHLKEPSGLGWVTRLPEGNNIAAIFSIGDQNRVNEWYKNVRKPFGVIEFTAAPIAVPPTLTIFVQHKSVDLAKLKIPKGITVTSGHVPTLFHRSNTTLEKKQEAEAAKKDKAEPEAREKLDPGAQAAADRIAAFLKKQNIKDLAPDGKQDVPAQKEDDLREFTDTITAPAVYKDLMLVLVTKKGVAAVVFPKEIDGGVEYKYRYESADGKFQKMGTGKLTEKGALPRRSDLFIEAGPIPLRWSYADEGKGWIYYDPSKLSVHLAKAADLEDRFEPTPFDGPMQVLKLELKRFLRK